MQTPADIRVIDVFGRECDAESAMAGSIKRGRIDCVDIRSCHLGYHVCRHSRTEQRAGAGIVASRREEECRSRALPVPQRLLSKLQRPGDLPKVKSIRPRVCHMAKTRSVALSCIERAWTPPSAVLASRRFSRPNIGFQGWLHPGVSTREGFILSQPPAERRHRTWPASVRGQGRVLDRSSGAFRIRLCGIGNEQHLRQGQLGLGPRLHVRGPSVRWAFRCVIGHFLTLRNLGPYGFYFSNRFRHDHMSALASNAEHVRSTMDSGHVNVSLNAGEGWRGPAGFQTTVAGTGN